MYIYSDGVTAEQVERALYKPCEAIGGTIERLHAKYGKQTRICVIPDGPQTIAYVKQRVTS